MIIANGTLEFKHKQPRGIDPNTGHPLEPIESWSEPVPCQYYATRSDYLAHVGTESRKKVSYTILIEGEAQSECLRLKDERGNVVGEFSAVSIDPLRAVGQTKIVVSCQ